VLAGAAAAGAAVALGAAMSAAMRVRLIHIVYIISCIDRYR